MGSYNEDRVTWYYVELKKAFLIARDALEGIQKAAENGTTNPNAYLKMSTQALEAMKKEKEIV